MTELPRVIHDAVVALVDSEIQRAAGVAGGDINRAYAVTLVDGRRLFVKFNLSGPSDLFEAEAAGLNWLAQASALPTPSVVGYCTQPALLVLEYLAPGRPRADYDETLGRGLAQLHATAASSFGCLPNNYIGTLRQDNTGHPTFAEFFWRRRLEPQLRLAHDTRAVPNDWSERFQHLSHRLPSLLSEPAYPERVHGDLWSGNVLCDVTGAPVMIDPAAYGGHGEVDLAMMRLFGGFDSRVEAAYLEVRPLPPGLSERLRVLQLYPLLVHVNLFGGTYVQKVQRILDALR